MRAHTQRPGRPRHEASPKAHNELVGPQQSKEVIDEGVLQVFVPLECVAAVGVISTLLHLSSSAALHCTCSSLSLSHPQVKYLPHGQKSLCC